MDEREYRKTLVLDYDDFGRGAVRSVARDKRLRAADFLIVISCRACVDSLVTIQGRGVEHIAEIKPADQPVLIGKIHNATAICRIKKGSNAYKCSDHCEYCLSGGPAPAGSPD